MQISNLKDKKYHSILLFVLGKGQRDNFGEEESLAGWQHRYGWVKGDRGCLRRFNTILCVSFRCGGGGLAKKKAGASKGEMNKLDGSSN